MHQLWYFNLLFLLLEYNRLCVLFHLYYFQIIIQKVYLLIENLDLSSNLNTGFERVLLFWLVFIPVNCAFKSWYQCLYWFCFILSWVTTAAKSFESLIRQFFTRLPWNLFRNWIEKSQEFSKYYSNILMAQLFQHLPYYQQEFFLLFLHGI